MAAQVCQTPQILHIKFKSYPENHSEPGGE